jgi:hypothetical protein
LRTLDLVQTGFDPAGLAVLAQALLIASGAAGAPGHRRDRRRRRPPHRPVLVAARRRRRHGVILYFVRAVGFHLRVRDPATNAAIPLVLAIAALTLRLATT